MDDRRDSEVLPMTTEEGLLADILAKPDDDLPRLVYADWLDENGQTERAEFIRVQVGHNALTKRCGRWAKEGGRGKPPMWDEGGGPNLTARQRKLLADHGRNWFSQADGWRVKTHKTSSLTGPEVVVHRGFISEIRCTLADWCGDEFPACNRLVSGVPLDWVCPQCKGTGYNPGIGPQVVREHPVTRVVLTNVVVRSVLPRLASSSVNRGDAGPLFDVAFPTAIGGRIEGYYEELEIVISRAAIAWAKSQAVTGRECGRAMSHGGG